MTRAFLLVGTPKGAFILESDAARSAWSSSGPLCEGWPIHDLVHDPVTGTLYAAGGSPWYGAAVWKSADMGRTWTHSSRGLAYPEGQEPVKTVWSLAVGPDGSLLAGVEPAGLFRSRDGGETWEHVEGLQQHHSRPTWGPGAGGLILHTIVPHPTDVDRTWVGISAVGVFETRDGGSTWEARNVGVRQDYAPERYPETGQCVHKFVMAAGEPDTLYQQNHCGMYRSLDGGETWEDLSQNGLPSQFGFVAAAHPRDPRTWWILPLNGDDDGRYVPDGAAAVWRTRDRGDTWERLGDGLPQANAYWGVLREAMARDTLEPAGLAFGTKTGQLWHSRDEGDSWELVTRDLPEIWAVESVVLD